MTDEPSKPQIRALRDRIADREAAHGTPVKVEIAGFEGIRQLSHAIETQQLDRFALQNSVPDKVFWRWFWAFIVSVVLAVAIGLIQNALA